VTVTWVQPQVLDSDRIVRTTKKIDTWNKNLKQLLKTISGKDDGNE